MRLSSRARFVFHSHLALFSLGVIFGMLMGLVCGFILGFGLSVL